MYHYQDEQYSENIPVDTLSSRLLILLKDIDASVRANAASSLGFLLQTSGQPAAESVS